MSANPAVNVYISKSGKGKEAKERDELCLSCAKPKRQLTSNHHCLVATRLWENFVFFMNILSCVYAWWSEKPVH